MSNSALNDERVRQWWEGLHEKHEYPFPQECKKFLDVYRIFAQEIPNEQCYNYIASCGYVCNTYGEILLSKEEYLGYMNFQEMLEL